MTLAILIDELLFTLGLDWEVFIMLLCILVSLLFFARDIRIGAMTLFLLSISSYVMLRLNSDETFLSLLFIFISLVIMTLTLYITQSRRYQASLY